MKSNFIQSLAVIKFAATCLIEEHLEASFKDKALVIIRMADDIATRHNVQTQMDEKIAAIYAPGASSRGTETSRPKNA